MSPVPRPILDYWQSAFAGRHIDAARGFTLTVMAMPDRKRPAMLLETQDAGIRATLSPDLADAIGADAMTGMTVADLYTRLTGAGIRLHDPDLLFYRADDIIPTPDSSRIPRLLTMRDHRAFVDFQAAAPEQDREDAFVELDHWAVFGSFDGDHLVSAASVYPWATSPIVDLGVLTLPAARSKGHARAVVRAIAAFAMRQGRELQYRCQQDNHASVALAKACGLTLLSRWTVAEDAL